MSFYLNDLFEKFDIEKTQLNITAVKALIVAMISKEMCYQEKQRIDFDENIFLSIWKLYMTALKHFDPNYNRKTDFSLFFKYILDAQFNNQQINLHALFCPGYTKNGYKDYLGNTTIWKLKELRDILDMFKENGINADIVCYYSDVFLENCNYILEPNWQKQMEFNRYLFHLEGEKYFNQSNVKNMSDLSIFSSEADIEGYIDDNIMKTIKKSTYEAFKKGNEKFYKSLNFTDEQMTFRNERLITMYRIFSNYLNELNNSVFLPMENMYERENIFSENGTCTMYLKLKR